MNLSGLRKLYAPIVSAWHRGITWQVYEIEDLVSAFLCAHDRCGPESDPS
jgi:hypothetical protein